MREDLEFTVESWDRKGETLVEVLARAENLVIARGAYNAACRSRPGSVLTLRHRTRVIEKNAPE